MSTRPHNRQGLALVGIRGAGKSTVGRILAERLVRPFLDADVELEQKLGRSIASVFAEGGEALFRDWEERVLAELAAAHPGAVLATGGGVVLRESNRRVLHAFGPVVWLRIDPGEATARLRADRAGDARRPALTAAGTIDEIVAVARARSPLYESVADLTIDTTGRTAQDIADAILKQVSLHVGGGV